MPPIDIKKDFQDWAKGRTGLSTEWLVDVYTRLNNLTKEDEKALFAWAKSQEPKPTPPTPKKPTAPPPPKKPTVPKELIIPRTPYPKWWKDSLTAKIDLSAPTSQVLATVSGRLRLFVATIVITVTGETQISFTFGEAGSSGPIYLGGTDQPMGMVVAMGNSPTPCGRGSLLITATDPTGVKPSIGGWATCFVEEA